MAMISARRHFFNIVQSIVMSASYQIALSNEPGLL
jgi:hypothetical protein